MPDGLAMLLTTYRVTALLAGVRGVQGSHQMPRLLALLVAKVAYDVTINRSLMARLVISL